LAPPVGVAGPRGTVGDDRAGGHLFLGQDAEVREEINAFVASVGPGQAFA
jgi:hypothetical protein